MFRQGRIWLPISISNGSWLFLQWLRTHLRRKKQATNDMTVMTSWTLRHVSALNGVYPIIWHHVFQYLSPDYTICKLSRTSVRWIKLNTIVKTFTLLYFTLLYFTWLYFTLLYFCTPFYSTLLYSTLLYSTLLYSTVLYFTLLYSTLLYLT